MGSSRDLIKLRRKIDLIDQEILRLLNERAGIAMEISSLKQENSINVYDPVRERQIEKNVRLLNKGPLSDDSVLSVFREVISASRALQDAINVIYLGPKGSFSNQAAYHIFGSSFKLIPVETIEEIFDEVEKNKGRLGIIPIENSLEGAVGSVLDKFFKSDLLISAEYLEKISHFLLSKNGDINRIKVVASHPQALGQCKRWLSKHMTKVEILETSSTAKAAELASKNGKIAAIASEYAASIYKLKFIARHIEDSANNTTRFWVLGRKENRQTDYDKTSVLFSLKDEPGALKKVLVPFTDEKINLTKIESRPNKERTWEYVFFVDFKGHFRDRTIKKVLSKVKKSCIFLKVLGSYPAAPID